MNSRSLHRAMDKINKTERSPKIRKKSTDRRALEYIIVFRE